MHIILSETATSSKRKHKLVTRFETLLEKVREREKANTRYLQHLDALVAQYHEEILPLQRATAEPIAYLVDKLTVMASRKTLPQWQRDELDEWARELLDELSSIDPERAQALNEKLHVNHNLAFGISEEETRAESAEIQEQARRLIAIGETASSAEELEALLQQFCEETGQTVPPELLAMMQAKHMQEDWLAQEEDEPEQATHDNDTRTQADDAATSAATDTRETEELTRGDWVHTLFRRTARALHPDKVQDPQEREARQQTMVRLLEARKQGDLLTLMQLYGEYCDQDKLALAETELQQACEMLERRLDNLQSELDAKACDTELRAFIYERYFDRSAKKRQANIEMAKSDMQERASALQQVSQDIRSLKTLRPYLETRRSARYRRDFSFSFYY